MEPVLSREPLFVRACASFVANLALILKVAMLAGTLLFIRDADLLLERFRLPAPVLESLPVAEVQPGEPQDAPAPPEPALSDSARHFLNCTYEAYRNAHYDECVDGDSEIYARPDADPDNRGGLLNELPVRYARLDESAPRVADAAG
jgi:hypothetical protein